VTLLLALTEQFDRGIGMQETLEVLHRIRGAYNQCYYLGIIHERRALALFRHSDFRSGQAVHSLLREAMKSYEDAEPLRPHGNDDALLRWNACARFLGRIPHLAPDHPVAEPAVLSE